MVHETPLFSRNADSPVLGRERLPDWHADRIKSERSKLSAKTEGCLHTKKSSKSEKNARRGGDRERVRQTEELGAGPFFGSYRANRSGILKSMSTPSADDNSLTGDSSMTGVTQVLCAMELGDSHAAERLLPLVYDALRKMAAEKMAHEAPGHTLQATALVHEAYLRLVDGNQFQKWNSRGHFFAAAGEAMRRILVERARRQGAVKRGGLLQRVGLNADYVPEDQKPEELLALDEALEHLERHNPQAASLVKLRYFSGLTHQEAADALGISRRAADHLWSLSRAWLYQQLYKP
jgi:RNA polymerase sigma factor (TIGR02999 family)